MLNFLHKYAKNYHHSQNGEEGILLECWRRLCGIDSAISADIAPQDGTLPLWMAESGRAVEIGGNDGLYCSNIALFAEHGWDSLFVEADFTLYQKCVENWQGRYHVRSQCSRVDGRNVHAFVGDDCDLLSIDTDGSDYDIFCGMLARPKIVIVEIDSSIEPPSERVNSDGGVGYWTMTVAALERGYFVI